MVRTQIYITHKEYSAAKRKAKHLGISLSELIRRCLRDALAADDSAPWMRFAGMVQSDDAESSQRINEVVYD